MTSTLKLNLMALILAPLMFASKVAAGSDVGTAAEAAVTVAAEAAPAKPALTIKKLEDILSLPEDEKNALIKAGQTRAATGLPVEYKEDPNQADGIARAANGRKIRKYVAPRDPNIVASEELIRLQRLPWAQTCRAKCNEIMARRKDKSMTDDEVQGVLANNGAPASYQKAKASKRLFSRVVSYVTMPLAKEGTTAS